MFWNFTSLLPSRKVLSLHKGTCSPRKRFDAVNIKLLASKKLKNGVWWGFDELYQVGGHTHNDFGFLLLVRPPRTDPSGVTFNHPRRKLLCPFPVLNTHFLEVFG